MQLDTRSVGSDDHPRLLITAGVHGDEFEPMVAVRRLHDEFSRRPLRGRVTLAPIVNGPAFARGQRTAEDGLDLARTCPGRDDGSVTEQIAAALSRLIAETDYYIDLHTGGRLFDIWPMSGYGLHPDQGILDVQRQMAKAFNLPVCWGTSPRLDGRSLSVARDARKPALYAEYGGGGGCRPTASEAYVVGCLQVARQLGLLPEEPEVESRVRYVVEDDRDQSGHLQIQHPAPAGGFFEPSVELGQSVLRGEPLGAVVDAWGACLAKVPAAHDGTVLFLRVQPPVHAGDPLGGLLPILSPGQVRIERQAVG